MKSSTHWFMGRSSKNNTSQAKEESRGNAPVNTNSAKAKISADGPSLGEKVQALEALLAAKNEELKEKNNTIKCLQDFRAGIGLRSSAADFYHIQDKECRRLIEETQVLYRELEEFNETVNFDDKSKYEPPVPPTAKLMVSSNIRGVGEPIVPRHYQRIASNSSEGPAASAQGNSKLANIRWNWEEHNLKIIDLNNRLKAAYDYISEMSQAKGAADSKTPKGPITTTSVMKTERTPQQEAAQGPPLWYVPQKGTVDAKQKNMLLSMLGDEDDEESEEENVYRAYPTKAFESVEEDDYAPTLLQSKNYAPVYEGGEKPDWLDEVGEIHIVPVEATLLDSLQGKAAAVGGIKGPQAPVREPVKEPEIVPRTPSPVRKVPEAHLAPRKMPVQSSLKSNSCDSDVSVDDRLKSTVAGGVSKTTYLGDPASDSKPVISSGYQLYMSNTKKPSQLAPMTTQTETGPQYRGRPSAQPTHQISNGYNSDVD